jgi:hypothetical protein
MAWYVWFVAGWIAGWAALVGTVVVLSVYRDWRAKANYGGGIKTSSRAQYERERAKENASG